MTAVQILVVKVIFILKNTNRELVSP